jgi:hypothetical protein
MKKKSIVDCFENFSETNVSEKTFGDKNKKYRWLFRNSQWNVSSNVWEKTFDVKNERYRRLFRKFQLNLSSNVSEKNIRR